jgi:hypothetical protein
MDYLKPDALYLVSILIVPGLLSQSVFNYLIERGKTHTLDIYQGLIHSFYIYTILFPISLLIWKTTASTIAWFNNYPRGPLTTALVLLGVSIAWGIGRAWFYRNERLEKLFSMVRVPEPPNLYAALLDAQFAEARESDSDRIWITVRFDDVTIVGSLDQYSLRQTPREIELKNVVYYANDGNVTELLPEVSVVVRVDDAPIVEIRRVEE